MTPRNSVREEWNKAALIRHCDNNRVVLYVSHAEDTVGPDREQLSLAARVTVAGMQTEDTERLADRVELWIGMKAMVMITAGF